MPYYTKDPKRDHNFDNYPYMYCVHTLHCGANQASQQYVGISSSCNFGRMSLLKTFTIARQRVIAGAVLGWARLAKILLGPALLSFRGRPGFFGSPFFFVCPFPFAFAFPLALAFGPLLAAGLLRTGSSSELTSSPTGGD